MFIDILLFSVMHPFNGRESKGLKLENCVQINDWC